MRQGTRASRGRSGLGEVSWNGHGWLSKEGGMALERSDFCLVGGEGDANGRAGPCLFSVRHGQPCCTGWTEMWTRLGALAGCSGGSGLTMGVAHLGSAASIVDGMGAVARREQEAVPIHLPGALHL